MLSRQKEKFQVCLAHFLEHQPVPNTELTYRSDFELLVAVVLSAQCTDKRINEVTPALFEFFPTPERLARASFDQVYPLIRTVSYPKNKSQHIIQLAHQLVTTFHGQVPKDPKQLQTLRGVGRKTAHVVAATLFQQPVLGVDTHVFRVAKRIGLASPKAKTPTAVEKELVRHTAPQYLSRLNHWLVLHGRYICKARKPLCAKCPFTSICDFFKQKEQTHIPLTDKLKTS